MLSFCLSPAISVFLFIFVTLTVPMRREELNGHCEICGISFGSTPSRISKI